MGLTGGTWSVRLGLWDLLVGLGLWDLGGGTYWRDMSGTWVGLGHHQTQFVEPVPHVECRLIKYS